MTRAGLLSFFVLLALAAPLGAQAQSASEIQSQIDANKRQLQALEAEIASFQKELDAVSSKKNTLQSTINSLTLTQKQLSTQIRATENKISSANLEIRRLSDSISDKEEIISSNQQAIGKAIRTISATDEMPIIARLAGSEDFGDAWKNVDAQMQFNRALAENIRELRAVKVELTANREEVSAARAELVRLQRSLAEQKRSVDASKAAQQELLKQTQNQESNYQKLIAEKQAAGKAFEQELLNLQGQLDLIVNPSLLPKVGSGVLSWPFSTSFMQTCSKRKAVFGNIFCVSQFFGNTPFSTANPQIYNGGGHPGMDVAAPIGTPIKAAASGTVLATGNTDAVRGCYSFGKWVMIIHGNGINTLYAHLSTIDVSKGQQVASGQTIGLSGMTGYATGPHLHFGVYATDGTQIMTLKQFRGASGGCANATMPVAATKAYLNPLSYL